MLDDTGDQPRLARGRIVVSLNDASALASKQILYPNGPTLDQLRELREKLVLVLQDIDDLLDE